MATKKKMLQAAAGNAGGAGAVLNVEDVFSTYLYTGNGSTQTINNGINLGDNLTGPYTEIADPISGVGGYLYRNSDLSGNADGKTLTFSGWAYNTGGNFYLYRTQPLQDTGTRFQAIMSNGLFKVQGYNSSNTKILDTGWRTVSLNNWYHFLISVDLSSTSNRYLYINDVEELGPSSSWTTYTNDSINFTNSHHYVNAYRSSANNGVDAGGGLAQIYLDYTYRDLSVVSNRRTFVTANIAPAGNLSSLNPILYLPFDATNSTGSNLGTGGDFVAYNTSYFEAKETGGPGYDAGSGEGGLVVIKRRDGSANNWGWYDTERGPDSHIKSNGTNAANTQPDVEVKDFNSNGFDLGTDWNANINTNGGSFCSWTFRKAEKFFDIQTWTGNSTAGRTISHNLEAEIGFIAIKCTSASGDWMSWHRSASPYAGRVLKLNATDAAANISSIFNSTNPTSTEFTLGSSYDVNGNGQTYVAYLWAHNDGDGEFGPDRDKDIIKCGSYSGNGSSQHIDLGFEPQWILHRRSNSSAPWRIYDAMRGIPVGSADAFLEPNANSTETTYNEAFQLTPTGFTVPYSAPYYNASGDTYIYIAIRRGSLVPPEAATDVFAIDTSVNASFPRFTSNFPVDFAISTTTNAGDPRAASSRLTSGKWMRTNGTNAESTNSAYVFDSNDGYFDSTFTNGLAWMWKRAPSYFDCVAYSGTGSTRTVAHNLGAAPEMMWFKGRNQSAYNWMVYHKNISPANGVYLSDSGSSGGASFQFANTAPTATVFTVSSGVDVNSSNEPYIAYLFASLAGISKVGSYTGTGSAQTIDCGFSSGARFVLIKCTSQNSTPWLVFDSVRGITTGVDPHLRLDSTDAEASQDANDIEPHSSGFIVNSANNTNNGNGENYIFYAIA